MKKAINQSTLFIITNAITIALVIVAIVFVQLLTVAGGKFDDASRDRFDLTLNANRFMDGSAYLTSEVRNFAATGDKRHYDNYWNEINNLKNRDIGVENMQAIGITAEEKAVIDAMASLSNNLVPLEDQAMQLTMAGEQAQAIEMVFGEAYEQTITQIRAHKDKFLSMLDERAAGEAAELRVAQNDLDIAVLAIVIIVGVMQLVNVIIIMKTTIYPIKKLQKEMEEMASGNLSSKLDLAPNTSEIGRLTDSIIKIKSSLNQYIGDISSKLEAIASHDMDIHMDMDYIGFGFGPIKDSLEKIVDSFDDTLSHIGAASQQVASGSQEIANGAQSLAQGSASQAATVQQLSASTAEISEKTKENAQMAEKAAALASTIKGNAEMGNRQMGEMVAAVDEISQASQSISKVIKAIDDIAFQTNMLALNAAVEAARAGQHGKGFAVVADEVRTLAAKSAEAARDTGALISNSMEKARQGALIAKDTADSLSEIVVGINESSKIISEIARASEVQASGIELINSGITHVALIVQENSSTSDKNAAASEALSEQSAMLENLITQFKLKGQGSHNRYVARIAAPSKTLNSAS